MNKIYQIYQVSDSTGETLDRIFLAIKAQFPNFNCRTILENESSGAGSSSRSPDLLRWL